VHPRDHDLVLGSYGRDLWIANIAPLQELNDAVLDEDVHFFSIEPAIQRITWSFGANDYLFGQRHLQTPNETNGMLIRYYLKASASGRASVAVTDASGKEMARLAGTNNAGINTVVWNMRAAGAGGRGAGGGGAGAGGGALGRGAANPLDQWAPLGTYTVTLEVGGKTLVQTGQITHTQGWSLATSPQIIR
jgi:hypothetical protein